MKENCYLTLAEALKVSNKIVDDNTLLSDGAQDWDINNLLEQADYDEQKEDGENNYYVVGHDGSIGKTTNNGYNIEWILQVVVKED